METSGVTRVDCSSFVAILHTSDISIRRFIVISPLCYVTNSLFVRLTNFIHPSKVSVLVSLAEKHFPPRPRSNDPCANSFRTRNSKRDP